MKNTSVLSYNKQIDGLRWFAVLGVLITHFLHFDNVYINRIPFGQGVNLFFVISGYLITKILLINKEKVNLKESDNSKVIKTFYFRRFLRIFPIYYLTIFFLLVINFQNTKDVWVWLVTYTTNFYVSNDHLPYIGSFNHLWSLAVEEQFYLIWPFVILFSPKKHLEKIIVGIILMSLIFKIFYLVYFGYSTAINALTISCADSLGFGALIAYWSLYRVSLIDKINKFKFAILLSLLPFIYFIIYPRKFDFIVITGNNFLFSIFAFFIVIKASQMKFSFFTKFLLENGIAVHLGKISYGIYLYHFFMPDFYNQMSDWIPAYFYNGSHYRTPFLFMSAIAFAECSWFIIEKPLLKIKDRFQ
jgi:peptidoglycan/LPS O-acetylase OafA/YrhL